MAKSKKNATPEEAGPTKKKGSLLKKIILLLIIVLLLGGGGLYVYLEFFDQSSETGEKAEQAAKSDKEVEGHSQMLHLDVFLVNLAEREGRRYLKVKLDLEIAGEKELKELEKVTYKIRDSIILILSSKSFNDISTGEGKEKLRQEIVETLKTLPGGKKIHGAYFTEFVAQ